MQGVGFRPFVWQLAQQLNLHGDVCNDGDGVEVRLLEDPETFLVQLHQHCPPLARIDSVEREPFIWSQLPTEFTIRQSAGGAMNTQIVPDAATCPACLAEMNTPCERRYRYPFINCTHCGPRFTIIRAMPYDRPFTVMAEFPLCPACDKEYRDPLDRRFHAQPVACPECGPHLEWVSHGEHAEQEAALQAAIAQLKWATLSPSKGLADFILPAMHVTVTRWRHFGRANIVRRNRWRSCCQWLTVYQTLRASCLPRPPRRLCWWIKIRS